MEAQQQVGAQALLLLGSKGDKNIGVLEVEDGAVDDYQFQQDQQHQQHLQQQELQDQDNNIHDIHQQNNHHHLQQLDVGELDEGSSNPNNDDSGAGVDGEDDDEESKNQQLNDAVEAAVMRYVGGTLDSRKKRRHGSVSNAASSGGRGGTGGSNGVDDLMTDFSPWTGFLDEELTQSQLQQNHNQQQQQQQVPDFPYNGGDANRKRRRKKMHDSNVDPELTGLDSSEHDQLVQAAILDARELAKHLGNGGSLQEHDVMAAHNSLHNLPPHQAQQVIAAATAAVNQNDSMNSRRKVLKKGGQKQRPIQQQQLQPLQHQQHQQQQQQQQQHPNIQLALRQLPLQPLQGQQQLQQQQQQQHLHLPLNQEHERSSKFNHLTSVEALVEESAALACSWYNSLPQPYNNGPRAFSQEEISAVEHFISGYGHLHKVTRQDICNRIWSSERKKDNFWESLTRILPYRSRASVYKHVRRQFHVFEVRGKWTPDEDEYLKKLAATKEGNWKEIGELMGRMPEDCRDRWRNYIKCGDNRVLNKWSEAEEEKLKEIVNELLSKSEGDKENKSGQGQHGKSVSNGNNNHSTGLNWTIVSEKMNGVRSRIQCRYKWNKLMKKKANLRSSYMDPRTKLWLVQKIQSLGFMTRDAIDWDYIVHLYGERDQINLEDGDKIWTSSDFKAVFDKMETEVRDYKKRRLVEIVDELYSLYGKFANGNNDHLQETTAGNGNTQGGHGDNSAAYASERQLTGTGSTNEDVDDATTIANAAVAAVATVNSDDVQQQEYSLWR